MVSSLLNRAMETFDSCVFAFPLVHILLGSRTTTNSPVPQMVMGPWVNALKSFETHTKTLSMQSSFVNAQAFDNTGKTDQMKMYVKRLFSGGDHSFAFATPNNSESGYDDRAFEYVSFLFYILSLCLANLELNLNFLLFIDQIRK